MSPSFVPTWLLATVAAAALLGTSLASAGPLEAAERQEQLGRSRQSIERAVETFIDYVDAFYPEETVSSDFDV